MTEMWRCDACDTINDRAAAACTVCGGRRVAGSRSRGPAAPPVTAATINAPPPRTAGRTGMPSAGDVLHLLGEVPDNYDVGRAFRLAFALVVCFPLWIGLGLGIQEGVLGNPDDGAAAKTGIIAIVVVAFLIEGLRAAFGPRRR